MSLTLITATTSKRLQLLALSLMLGACGSLGPYSLQQARLDYNETVKSTTEQQLLLNIVRLRYTDTPSSLSISAIAAQFERSKRFGLFPFFIPESNSNGSLTGILPQAEIAVADRPTFSLTPLDDQEFTRKLFTPVPLDGVIYLAKTTWPISTVFRLYLENLNWVSNGQTASGPTPRIAPVFSDFNRGMQALQKLQDQGKIVFSSEERLEPVGGTATQANVSAQEVMEAAKNGFEYQRDAQNRWFLASRSQRPVLRVDPAALDSSEMRTVAEIFKLKHGVDKFDITQEALSPFPATYPAAGVASLDLETRSLLQALYFVSHGVDVPTEHLSSKLARQTLQTDGQAFDWSQITEGLFSVHSVKSSERPAAAHVAIHYQGYWFYIDESDLETKSTFSLLMELSRLELSGKTGPGPILTLPVGAH